MLRSEGFMMGRRTTDSGMTDSGARDLGENDRKRANQALLGAKGSGLGAKKTDSWVRDSGDRQTDRKSADRQTDSEISGRGRFRMGRNQTDSRAANFRVSRA